MYLYATPIINQQKSDIQDLNTSLDSVKAQLADANEKLNPQEDPNDTGSNTDASGTGETAVSGGVEMKVLEAGEQPTISFDTCGDGCSIRREAHSRLTSGGYRNPTERMRISSPISQPTRMATSTPNTSGTHLGEAVGAPRSSTRDGRGGA